MSSSYIYHLSWIVASNMKWLYVLLMIACTPAPNSCCQAAQESQMTVIVNTNCSSLSADAGSSACVELGEALSFIDSGTALFLYPGLHTVNDWTTLRDLTNISIIGRSEITDPGGEVVITCAQGQGLSFVNVSGLFLSQITISNCGLGSEQLGQVLHLTRDYVELFVTFSPSVQVAVFMGLCMNVFVTNVTIANTTGIGLVGVNILGNSMISGGSFVHNRQPLDGSSSFSKIGGGAYFFDGDFLLNASNVLSSEQTSVLTLTESLFGFNTDSSNVALVEANYHYIIYGSGEADYPVGGGGGLTVMLAHRYFPVSVQVNSCSFVRNSAAFGGGAHVGLFAGVQHSHVSFVKCLFESNGIEDGHGSSSGGAGLSVFTGIFNPLHSNFAIATKNVSVSIADSHFVRNIAIKGGGLFTFSLYDGLTSITASTHSNVITNSPVISLLNCTFVQNTGHYGAAMSFEQRIDHGSKGNVAVVLSNITVAHNAHQASSQHDTFVSMASSAVNIEGIRATITESVKIIDNTVTGLYLSAGELIIASGATIAFVRNSGKLGGGIHLAGKLPIIISMPNSTLVFKENRAAVKGGAIYVTSQQRITADVLLPLNEECFFLPLSSERKCVPGNCYDLRELNIYVSFQDNEAPLGGAVYGSSLENCLWTWHLRRIRDIEAPGLQILQFLAVYYDDVFDFDQSLDDPSVVSTAPSSILINSSQDELMPGQQINLNVAIEDDYNNRVSAVISSHVSYNSENSSNATSLLGESGYWFADSDTSDALFKIAGRNDMQVNVTFFTTDTFSTTELTFVLGSCPLGIVYDSSSSSCQCDPRINIEGVICDTRTLEITVPGNIWMGIKTRTDGNLPVNGDLIIRHCGLSCVDGSKPFNPRNFDGQCSESLGRSGVLCGGCAPNLSSTFGSLGCQKCSNFSLFLIPIFALAGVLLFITIALLGFSIDKGWINIVLFYSNLLSIYGYDISIRYGVSGLFVPAALLSLQIGTSLCFYNGMTALSRTGTQLIFPAYLFMLMGVFALLCRRYSWLSERFSPTTTLVTLTVMCYVSTLNTCIDILGGITLVTVEGDSSVHWRLDPNHAYFGGYHSFLVVIAVILLAIYIIPFPIMMLFPSTLYKYTKKFKPFYDAFWAPFKLKYRFWLGVRLISLLVLFSLPRIFEISNIIPILIIYVIQYLQMVLKPFSSTRVNYVDNFLIGILAIVLVGSVYKELSPGQPSEITLWIEYIILVVIVSAGYVTIAGIFYFQLSINFALLKLKRIITLLRKRLLAPFSKSSPSAVVTHTEVSLEDNPSPAGTTLDFNTSSDPARLRESLLAS